MWLMPVPMPSTSSAAKPAWRASSKAGASTSSGSSTHHWIQGLRNTSSGPGRYSVRECQTGRPAMQTVSSECSSPVTNSSTNHGAPGPGGSAASAASSAAASSRR